MSQKPSAVNPAEQPEVQHHQIGQEVFKTILSGDVDWKPFSAGVRLAVIVGQPSEPGPYTIRVKAAPRREADASQAPGGSRSTP
jgi:hypothetical protein